MCGIAGCVRWDGVDPPESLLTAMARRLAHRGPDGRGIWRERGVGLVHTRLAVIDLETGDQPLVDRETGNVLVANGEIYNHVELRAELERDGFRFATRSDCEPVLHAWRRWGAGLVHRLRGMYAFALYDRAQRRLLLVRDRLGIKPLFYARTASGLAFASELKALLPALDRGPAVRPEALAGFLQTNFVTGRQTILAGIERLLPGELMLVDADGRVERRRYWRPGAAEGVPRKLDEAVEAFEALMGQVIEEHLRSDVPIGIFLSGGIDSSGLLAAVRRRTAQPLKAWTVAFRDPGVHDESETAARVAARHDVAHEVLQLGEDRLLARLPHAVWAADDLMGDYAALPVSLLAQRAAASHKVVLSGEGGDEAFAGYGRYRVGALRGMLRAVASGGMGFRARPIVPARVARELFVPELHRAMAAEWAAPFRRAWREARRRHGTLAGRQIVDLETWLPDDLLVKVDRELMAWGVEGRVPYLDHRVVEFGLGLPARLKVRGRRGKVLLREWAARHLPPDVVAGRKRGFTVPVRAWLRGGLLHLLERRLEGTAMARAWLRPGALQRLVAAQRRTGRWTRLLWGLLVAAVWWRIVVEEGAAGPPPADAALEDFLA